MRDPILALLAVVFTLLIFVVLGITMGFAIAQMWTAVHALTWVLAVITAGATICGAAMRK